MAHRQNPGKTRPHHAAVALACVAAFLFSVALTAAPGLHEHFHADAATPQHECAVTAVGSGKVQLGEPALAVTGALRPVSDPEVSTLTPAWVPAPFLSAAILEHAPPALS